MEYWKMENLKMENGKWNMGNGKWNIENRNTENTKHETQDISQK